MPLEPIGNYNGYKLGDTCKQQIDINCFSILRLASCNTEAAFEVVD